MHWVLDAPNLFKDNKLPICQLQLNKGDAHGACQLLPTIVLIMR